VKEEIKNQFKAGFCLQGNTTVRLHNIYFPKITEADHAQLIKDINEEEFVIGAKVQHQVILI